MLAAIAWKEYREHRAIWLAIAGITAALLFLQSFLGSTSRLVPSRELSFLFCLAMSATYGLVAGAMMLAGEREGRTLTFLDSLSARRTPIWTRKVVMGAGFCIAQAVCLGLILAAIAPAMEVARPVQRWFTVPLAFAPLIFVSIVAFAWGLFFSSIFRSVMIAAAFAALGLPLAGAPIGNLFGFPFPPQWTVVVGGLTTAFVLISWRLFCETDVRRRDHIGLSPLAVAFATLSLFIMAAAVQEASFPRKTGIAQQDASRELPISREVPITVAVLAAFIVGCIAVFSGAGMLANPSVAWRVLSAKPQERLRMILWLRRFVRGFAITLISAILFGLIALAADWFTAPAQGRGIPVFLGGDELDLFLIIGIMLELFALATFTSAICRGEISATTLAILIAFWAYVISFFFIAAIDELWINVPKPQLLTLMFAIHALLSLAAIGLSFLIFCRSELAPPGAKWTPPLLTAADLLTPATWRAPMWLIWRQLRGIALALAVLALFFAFMLGLASPMTMLGAWMCLTLLIGIVCGVGVFAGEQLWGANRFLADQRLPIGVIWTAKVVSWLMLAIGVSLIMLFGPAISLVVMSRRDNPIETDWLQYLWTQMGPANVLLMALIYGFAIGQFFSLIVKKSVVAGVMAILISPFVVAIWLPSLFGGGLGFWTVMVVPILLLLATRLTSWAWAASALTQRKPILLLISFGLLSMGWIAGALWYRVAEVPYGDEPFDVNAFIASLPKPEENKAGFLLQTVARQLQEAEQKVEKERLQSHGGRLDSAEQIERVLDESEKMNVEAAIEDWPEKNHPVNRKMDILMAGEWATKTPELLKLPLGVVVDPQAPAGRLWELGVRLSNAALYHSARALQLQANGDHAAGVEHFAIAFAISRNLRHKSTLYYGWSAERHALVALDQWVTKLGPNAALLRRMLGELDRHEAETPSFDGHLKAVYVAARQGLWDLTETFGKDNVYAQHFDVLWHVPWEHARRMKLLNASMAGAFLGDVMSDRQYVSFAKEMYAQVPTNWDRADINTAIGTGWLPPNGEAKTVPRIWKMVGGGTARHGIYPLSSSRFMPIRSRQQIRAAHLRLALALYQVENGKPAASLNDLVPKYLSSLPIDPYSDQPFRYRVSSGETLRLDKRRRTPEGPVESKVAAGQGVIWSVGADQADDGGKQLLSENDIFLFALYAQKKTDLRGDLIDVVPVWPEKK